jgi:hypothetical protein
MFCLEKFILDVFQIAEKKKQSKNQQLFDKQTFDVIIDDP